MNSLVRGWRGLSGHAEGAGRRDRYRRMSMFAVFGILQLYFGRAQYIERPIC